ncbi:hypothetical protein Tco_0571362 [Tanacetum coccineum]
MLSRISFPFLKRQQTIFDVLYYLGHMFRPLDFFYVIHVDLIIGSRCLILAFSGGGDTDGGSDDEGSAATNSVMHALADGDHGVWC